MTTKTTLTSRYEHRCKNHEITFVQSGGKVLTNEIDKLLQRVYAVIKLRDGPIQEAVPQTQPSRNRNAHHHVGFSKLTSGNLYFGHLRLIIIPAGNAGIPVVPIPVASYPCTRPVAYP